MASELVLGLWSPADVVAEGFIGSGLGNFAAASGPSLHTSALKSSISLLIGLQGMRVSAVRCALVRGSVV